MQVSPITPADPLGRTRTIVDMTWMILTLAFLAWGPVALGIGLLVGPVLRRAHQPAPLTRVATRADGAFVLR